MLRLNRSNNVLFLSFLAVAMGLLLPGCGIKGDPLPPELPTEIGRGRPTYSRAEKAPGQESRQYKKKKKKQDHE